MFVLWVTFLIFVILGITVGVILGTSLGGGIAALLNLPVDNLTGVSIVGLIILVLFGLSVGIYLFCLLWMLCVRPFFTGYEVREVVFYSPTWVPEQWLFKKLYPDVPILGSEE
jgi:hypothetical protein